MHVPPRHLLEPRLKAADSEVKIDLKKDLPKPILDAANAHTQGVDWKQATKLKEGDETWYELVGVLGKAPNKRLVTLEIDEDGEVFHAQKMIAPSEVPAVVLKAFQGKFPRSTPKYVFEVVDAVEDSEVTTYEFLTTRPVQAPAGKGKKGGPKGKAKKEEEITVVVSADGKSVDVQGEEDN